MKISTFKPWLILFYMFFCLACKSKVHEDKKNGIEYNEVKLREFVKGIQYRSKETTIFQLDSLLKNASIDSIVFRKIISFITKPISDPNSPLRDESIYAMLLNAQLNSKWYSRAEKQQVSLRLHLLGQNRVGYSANDFGYITPNGNQKRLYEIRSKYVLLYFYNPECDACRDMKKLLEESSVTNAKIEEGKLSVLAIYPDMDEQIWRSHLLELPKCWIHGRDENEHLYKDQVYDLIAIPTVYLLDSNKKVLLKDCLSIEEIEHKILE